jgi:positive regulator of sigma E activity
MRTVASALLLFVINLIGMGIGPWLAGFISDVLAPTYGKDSLRYALLILTFLNIWAAAHYWLAGKYFERDLKRMTKAV